METRNTIQRSLVLDTVRELKCHATAEEVYRAVVAKQPNISKATVYRNLNLLAEKGEILKLEMPDGANRFDHITADHYHLICEKCGRYFDLDLSVFAPTISLPESAKGFLITGQQIMFKGICPDCQKNTK